jgi:hypothetical protein
VCLDQAFNVFGIDLIKRRAEQISQAAHSCGGIAAPSACSSGEYGRIG